MIFIDDIDKKDDQNNADDIWNDMFHVFNIDIFSENIQIILNKNV